MIISPGGFFKFSKFDFLGCQGAWKGKKWPKMTKISVYRTLYFRNHISYDLHLWYTFMCKRIISPGIFFIFFKIWFSGGKKAKNGPKWQENSVCLTPYYMIVIFGTHVKSWYLQRVFSVFKILIFGFLGGLKGKKWPKMVNFSMFCSTSQELVDHVIEILMMISTGVFLSLFFFKNATL